MPNVRLSDEAHSKAIQLAADLTKEFGRLVTLGEAVEYALDECRSARQLATSPVPTEV